MALSKVIDRHHTVWIWLPNGTATPVRYSTTDEEMICFGDGVLSKLQGGQVVRATVFEIACGPPLETMQVKVQEVRGTTLSLATIAAVHGNAPDPLPDGSNTYAALQKTRRFLSLTPISDDSPNEEVDRDENRTA